MSRLLEDDGEYLRPPQIKPRRERRRHPGGCIERWAIECVTRPERAGIRRWLSPADREAWDYQAWLYQHRAAT